MMIRLHRAVFVLALILVASNVIPQRLSGGISPPTDASDPSDVLHARLTRALKAELQFLDRVCALTPEQLKRVDVIGREEVRDAVWDWRASLSRSEGGLSFAESTQAFKESLAKRINPLLAPEQIRRYAVELGNRQADFREAGIQNVMALLDELLLLDAWQREQLAASLSYNWNEKWSPTFQDARGPERLVQELPQGLIVPALSPLQRENWKLARNQPVLSVLSTLNQWTEFEARDLPLEDCLRFLSRFHNVSFRIDDAVGKEAPLHPINMEVSRVSLRSALEILLKSAAGWELGYEVRGGEIVVLPRNQVTADAGEPVFEGHTAGSLQRLLRQQLLLEIDIVTRCCGLPNDQAQTLEAAGRQDIEQFLTRATAIQKEWTQEPDDEQQAGLHVRSTELHKAYFTELFSSGSQFAKTLGTSANDPQRAEYKKIAAERLSLRHQAAVELFVAVIDDDVSLISAQRQKLRELLLQSTSLPFRFGPSDFDFVGHQSACLAQAQLDGVLSKDQRLILQAQLFVDMRKQAGSLKALGYELPACSVPGR